MRYHFFNFLLPSCLGASTLPHGGFNPVWVGEVCCARSRHPPYIENCSVIPSTDNYIAIPLTENCIAIPSTYRKLHCDSFYNTFAPTPKDARNMCLGYNIKFFLQRIAL